MRRQKKINFIKLLKGYESGWVAISADFSKVILWGKTLREVMGKAKKIEKSVFYFPVEKSYSNFIGLSN